MSLLPLRSPLLLLLLLLPLFPLFPLIFCLLLLLDDSCPCWGSSRRIPADAFAIGTERGRGIDNRCHSYCFSLSVSLLFLMFLFGGIPSFVDGNITCDSSHSSILLPPFHFLLSLSLSLSLPISLSLFLFFSESGRSVEFRYSLIIIVIYHYHDYYRRDYHHDYYPITGMTNESMEPTLSVSQAPSNQVTDAVTPPGRDRWSPLSFNRSRCGVSDVGLTLDR